MRTLRVHIPKSPAAKFTPNTRGPRTLITHEPGVRYVMPEGIATTRTFDEPTIAPEAHYAMIDRMSGERWNTDDDTNDN